MLGSLDVLYSVLIHKLIAVYEEQEAQQRGAVSPAGVSGSSEPDRPSPEPYDSELSIFQPIRGGEIEVNSSALKSNTPLLVRSSSESALSPPADAGPPQCEEQNGRRTPAGMSHALMDKPLTDGTNSNASPYTPSLTRTVEISGEKGPLGIHVVPFCSSLSGRTLGLHIRGVEENSRSKREGIFHDDECIVRINDTELMDKTFTQSQEVFRQAMRSPTVRLEVVPVGNRELYEKSIIGSLLTSPDPPTDGPPSTKKTPPPVKVKPTLRPPPGETPDGGGGGGGGAGVLEVRGSPGTPRPPSRLSPNPKGRSESPLLRKSLGLPPLAGLTGKKGGKKLRVDLKKGPEGLGFTVVTRDSSGHTPGPILVKNILPRGAAIKDGRLQSGDRILEVNGVDITGRTQEELVVMLRSTKQGESVSLVISRQEEMFLPRELKEEVSRPLLCEDGKEQMMFEVPLSDSGSAGLGISLKGNKARDTGEDLGIFIKSIIHGGAAYKDGRLRVNDQLVAVNGESLLGKSNHEAMETLRRSMSNEGNLRGLIQLLVLRPLLQTSQEQAEVRRTLNRSFDSCTGHMSAVGQANRPAQAALVLNSLYQRADFHSLSNGGYGLTEEGHHEEDGTLLRSQHEADLSSTSPPGAAPNTSSDWESGPGENSFRSEAQGQVEHHHVKSSKSMDLVADESNVGALTGQKPVSSLAQALGPTLGLKKSSSLESLQTAVSEAQRVNQQQQQQQQLLPFHRPRPHMVRGRGCNESFRAAIDKSYDGPPEDDDDDFSDQSSGRDTPASSSSRLGDAEEGKKDKKKKTKGKKKDKMKAKGKEKEREKEKEKKKEDGAEELDKKSKKKGFALLRFGKKKETKTLIKHTADILSEEELERMKEERERIEAKHQELRDRQARDRYPTPDMEDDAMDPNYARIHAFRVPSSPPLTLRTHTRSPSPQSPPRPPLHAPGPPVHSREPSGEDALDGLYAKVNKQRAPAPAPSTDRPDRQTDRESMDRIQQLRREYQQARREGAAPAYEDLESRRRGPEYDPHRMPVRGPEPRLAPRYEDVERQYASLPRRGPMDPSEYPLQAWGGGSPHRDPGLYPSPPQPTYHHPHLHPAYPSRDGYPQQGGDPRQADPGYYPPPPVQPRGPLRQDVPPSPPVPVRAPRYDTLNRGPPGGGGGGGYRQASPERYAYGDPRQTSAMTAAV